MSEKPRLKIAVVGSGPAGLMTASRLSEDPRFEVHVFEKRKGFGRKLLIAGSSGLNISHDASMRDFSEHYTGWNTQFWSETLTAFSSKDWVQFIEKELRLETFLGTSDRYFVKEMKASGLLKGWIEKLQSRGVLFYSAHELVDFKLQDDQIQLFFQGMPNPMTFDQAAFLLGGASWLGEEGLEPAWASVFRRNDIRVVDFEASNVGYEVEWPAAFLKEAEGKPFKKVLFQSSRGKKLGELVITSYGLEGTPIYFFGTPGKIILDLKPDLTLQQLQEKCLSVTENLSPIRRVKKVLALNEAALALVFHLAPEAAKKDLNALLKMIKAFPIQLVRPRPLSESISSKGGVALTEVDQTLEMLKFKGIYCGGEMLDWDAPTGGFLIQASVSQGYKIAESIRAKADRNKR